MDAKTGYKRHSSPGRMYACLLRCMFRGGTRLHAPIKGEGVGREGGGASGCWVNFFPLFFPLFLFFVFLLLLFLLLFFVDLFYDGLSVSGPSAPAKDPEPRFIYFFSCPPFLSFLFIFSFFPSSFVCFLSICLIYLDICICFTRTERGTDEHVYI